MKYNYLKLGLRQRLRPLWMIPVVLYMISLYTYKADKVFVLSKLIRRASLAPPHPPPLFQHSLHHCGLVFLRCQFKCYFLNLITVAPLANDLTQRVKTKRWHHLRRRPSYYRGRDCINVSHLQELGNCLKWRAVNWHSTGITQVIRKERVCGIY